MRQHIHMKFIMLSLYCCSPCVACIERSADGVLI